MFRLNSELVLNKDLYASRSGFLIRYNETQTKKMVVKNKYKDEKKLFDNFILNHFRFT